MGELDAAAQLTTEDDDRFAVLSSGALRRHLEASLNLSFSACTSEEFLRSLKVDTRFDAGFQSQLGEVLAAFDRVKFASHTIRPDERTQLTDTVRRLIEQSHHEQSEKGDGQ